jgi:hypothetical protein
MDLYCPKMDLYCVQILLHDLKNQLQKMLAILHLYPEDTEKTHAQILRMSTLIKLYENLYIKHEYEDPVETIGLIRKLYNRVIEFDEAQIHSVESQILKVALIYVAWIAKDHSLVIKIPFEGEVILSSKDVKVGEYYSIEEAATSSYAHILSELSTSSGVSIKTEPEYILLSLI